VNRDARDLLRWSIRREVALTAQPANHQPVLAFASYEGQGNVEASKHTVMVINAVFAPSESGRATLLACIYQRIAGRNRFPNPPPCRETSA